MNRVVHVAGIDPGLVHTGVVVIHLNPADLKMTSTYRVFDGLAADEVAAWLRTLGDPEVFIEKYVPRQHYGTDERMVQGERDFRVALPKSTLLRNTGIMKVVTQDLLELADLWKFATPTHHQDLRSAARIALLGILRDPEMNRVLARFVEAEVLHADAG